MNERRGLRSLCAMIIPVSPIEYGQAQCPLDSCLYRNDRVVAFRGEEENPVFPPSCHATDFKV
jgi:hypothetical protein